MNKSNVKFGLNNQLLLLFFDRQTFEKNVPKLGSGSDLLSSSVTRSGDLLDFGHLLNAFGNT